MRGKEIKAFQKEILDWYILHQRDLPWRKDREAYHILVSEVMLQQTQVQRVIPKYEAWIKAFPTLKDLADASTRDVLLHWSGLGYNRRALFLQKLAQQLVSRHSGKQSASRIKEGSWTSQDDSLYFPRTEKELRQLPGIGEYTARAVLCFAFDTQVAVVDTNVRKVIAVTFFEGLLPEEKRIQEIAKQLVPKGKAYEWNQALMDYAASILKEHKIPVPRQSRFKDSDRYFRGQILKRLLDTHIQTKKGLLDFFKEKNTPIEGDRLQQILMTMEKDKFIVVRKQEILLS